MRLTGKYRYLTFEDRKKIEAWHLLGDRPVDIAARLSVHHTTIYKELQRGATGALDANQREGYSAELAERRLRESFKRRGKRAPAAQYEADLTIRWLNLDNDDETIEATVHAVGWNDDPAKAKGAAHTYALKYYLFEKFTVDQGEDDPDNSDFGAQGKGSGAGGRQQAAQGRQGQGSGRLSDAQLARLYKKAEAAGMTKERTNARIVEKYKKQDPATLTRQEYDEICTSLDNAAAQHNQQGGNA